jgi:hypothetical protein
MLSLKHFKFTNSVIAIIGQLLERDVQIRAAYQWLDAQSKSEGPLQRNHNLELLIEDWAGLHITERDVSVAAGLHRSVAGGYPYLEIDPGFTFPSSERLRVVGASFERDEEEQPLLSDYHSYELAHYDEGEEAVSVRGFERQLLPEACIEPKNFSGLQQDCECRECIDGVQ